MSKEVLAPPTEVREDLVRDKIKGYFS